MIPAWIVALLSFSAGAFLIYEARKKSVKLYRDRWTYMALPFFYETAVYLLVEIYHPSSEFTDIFARGGYFSIVFAATSYFIQDLVIDMKDHWRRSHG